MKPVVDAEVCVVGLGYVGLPLAVALAAAGTVVVGFDVDEAKVAGLQAGRSPVDDVSGDDLAAVADRLTYTTRHTDIKIARHYVICVPTPLRDGLPDLTFVESAARAVGRVVEPGDLVVLESTTYPGTTEDFVAPILEEESGLRVGADLLLAYAPERIDPGNRSWTLHTTPKLVAGVDAASADAAEELYRRVVRDVVRTKGTREAEMAKLLENTFRHVNIALVNELAVFCNVAGIDIWDVIAAAATKPFGFMPFYPGPGVGGHCIPVDPSYLSWVVRKHGFQFHFVELAQEINARMPAYVVQRVGELLNESGLAISRSRILCIGASYKPGVADRRESPAIDVIRLLLARGADVEYHDPLVPELTIAGVAHRSVDLTLEAVAAVDLVVVLTPHDNVDWPVVRARARAVLDTRGVIPAGPTVQRL